MAHSPIKDDVKTNKTIDELTVKDLQEAAAVNKTKVIALFGPTSHIRNGAFNQVNLIADVPCQPCRKKICPLKGSEYMQCMTKLQPEKILEFVDSN